MRKETQEWIHDTAYEIITGVVAMIDEQGVPTDEQKKTRERAQQWLSYTDAHYKADEVTGDDEGSDEGEHACICACGNEHMTPND